MLRPQKLYRAKPPPESAHKAERTKAMGSKEKTSKTHSPTRTRRRVWFSVTSGQKGFGITIHPDFGTACKKACRLFLRTALLAAVLSVAGCDGAAGLKKVILAVVHSMFASRGGGIQGQHK